MDRIIYTAMSGAKQSLERQSAVANNMANVSTSGFRAELSAARAVPVNGAGYATRAITADSTPGSDFTPGSFSTTGRALDVAINGEGWLAVQANNGDTAYTRNGGLQVDPTGMLMSQGHPVMGEDGPIILPLNAEVSIAGDGTISAREAGTQVQAEVGRLMLASNPDGRMARREDGLFGAWNAQGGPMAALPRDEEVQVISGTLEGSNVNPTEAMVAMIDTARRFEMNMKVLTTADENDQRANSLLSMN
ncbi:flagellar basal body rod protein FlgF [uncultured Kushneria sp.]|uniref:flagellar basal body rod protein FlgF n=1 Tax=uncultured Kushneria sp. TaxID=905033 RepID=UPI0026291F32|nr:flagellar basal body rod protein FlgF [uncultured Kushneria sp.]